MPRTARKKSGSGIYHIVLRGINKQTVFYDDEDREVFLSRLKLAKETHPYKMYAFCLMNNHAHLLIREEKDAIGKIMQKVLTSYIYWYNRKYERVGNLFQDRYKSEPVDTDSYLLSAVRYIHQNPIKAGMEKSIGEYKWSSHSAYNGDKESLVDTEFVMKLLGGQEEYDKFINIDEEIKFLEGEIRIPISDKTLSERIEKVYAKYKITDINGLTKGGRDEILTVIKKIPGANMRQISRVTGVSLMVVRLAGTSKK